MNPSPTRVAFRYLSASRAPQKGDTVTMNEVLVPVGLPKDKFIVEDVRDKFTTFGLEPIRPQVLIEGKDGKPHWLWAWSFVEYGPAPTTTRRPEDDALKIVQTALRPFSRVLHRVTPGGRGDRSLEPTRSAEREGIPVDDIVDALKASPEVAAKGSNNAMTLSP